MELAFKLNTNVDEKREKELESSGKLPPGWYTAKVADCIPDTKDAFVKIEYEITSGPYAGRVQADRLWDPRAADDADKAKKTENRLLMITKRIGAREENSDDINFLKAIGRAVVIEMEPEADRICEACRTKPAKGLRKCASCGGKLIWEPVPNGFSNIGWDGVHQPDSEKIPEDVRKKLGLGPAKVTVHAPAPATGAPAGGREPFSGTTSPPATAAASTAAAPARQAQGQLVGAGASGNPAVDDL